MELSTLVSNINKKLDCVVVELDENEKVLNKYHFLQGQEMTLPESLKPATIVNVEIQHELLYIYVNKE